MTSPRLRFFMAIICLMILAFIIFTYRTSTRFAIRRAESVRARITPGTSWRELARRLEADRRWGLMTFDGERKSCGGLTKRSGVFLFQPPLQDDGTVLPEHAITTLSDPAVINRIPDCPSLHLRFYAGFYRVAAFDVEFGKDANVKSIGEVWVPQ